MNAEYYQLLKEFLSFKTVSTLDKEFEKEHKKCCEWLKSLFTDNGFKSDILVTDSFPFVLAKYEINPDAKTCLIYGNYDVSFADKGDGWKNDPFSLYFGKEKIYGRGIAGGKGLLLLYMLSIFNLIKENSLKYNVIFVVDGEKYLGSCGLKKFFGENKVNVDFILSSIGTSINNIPVLNSSFKGGFHSHLSLLSAIKNGNVGQYGGVMINAVEESVKLISRMYDSNNQITIPYFYYEVENISANEKTINSKIPFDKTDVLDTLGCKGMKLGDNDIYSKIGWKPYIELVGIRSGFGKYGLSLIPCKSSIDLEFCLVPNQKNDSIKNLFIEWLKSNIQGNYDYELSYFGESDPVKIDLQNPFADDLKSKLSELYGSKIYQISSGYKYPMAKCFQNNISQNIINIAFVNNDSDIDGVNENMDVELLEKAGSTVLNIFKV